MDQQPHSSDPQPAIPPEGGASLTNGVELPNLANLRHASKSPGFSYALAYQPDGSIEPLVLFEWQDDVMWSMTPTGARNLAKYLVQFADEAEADAGRQRDQIRAN